MLNLESLNDKQREAVTFESGNLLVLAGPGSGKTHVIIQRIFYLLEVKKVAPEKILVITFTKDAALEMQNRFLKLSDKFYPVVFGTFHSIFYHILRESSHSDLFLISSNKKRNLFSNIISKYIPDLSIQEKNSITEQVINSVSYYKNTLDKESAINHLPDNISLVFDIIYSEYEMARKKEKLIDFDDMVMDCYNLLKNNNRHISKWSARFSNILIDEFQDINPIQYETVKLLLGQKTSQRLFLNTLFVVGDDDQSIYSFRGAEPECLKRVITECNCKTINLECNYRNPEEIRHISEMIIKENKNRLDKKSFSMRINEKSLFLSDNNGLKNIEIRAYETRELQNESIVLLAEEKNANNEPTAILFRTNIEMQRLAILLGRKGIKYICNEKRTNIYDHFIIRDIMTYLRLAYVGINTEDLISIINKPPRYISREALLGEKDPFSNIISFYNSEYQNKNSQKVLSNVNILKKDLSFISKRHLFTSLEYILNKVGYRKYILGITTDPVKKDEYAKVINFLEDDIKTFDEYDDYVNAQTEYRLEDSHNDKQSCDNLNETEVALMTVHASKGLEYKNVIIAECNEGNFPHGRMPDTSEVEEERRLFYVAVTRSSDKLYLFYIKGTKERISIPSRFINCLLNDQEKRY